MNSMFQGTSKRAPSDGRNESSGYAGKKAPPEKDETTLPMARATAVLSAPAGSSLVGHSITVPNASIGTSGASLPLPARLKEATSEDSVVQNASLVNSDSASHEEEMDLGGAGETTPSNPPEEGQHNDLLKHIRQRNALYSRRKYYKRKQELERLEEMKHQLEVRNEALRRDNAQLERWMQLVQQQIPRERNNASSLSRQALLQRLLEQASSQPPSQYSTTAAAAAAVANRPVTFTGVHDSSSLRALELQQLLCSTGSSSSMQDLLLPSAVRSSGLTPPFAAPSIDMRRLLASQRMTPPAAHLGELSNVPMDVPSTLSHLLSRNPSSSILQRTTPASLLPSQQQQLLASLRDQNTAAFIDQARREDEEQLLLLQLLQQQQPIDPNSVLLGPLSTRSALTSQDVLLQLLQNKQREEQALLRQWSSSSSQEDLLWQLQKQRSLPPPKGPPPPH